MCESAPSIAPMRILAAVICDETIEVKLEKPMTAIIIQI